MGLAYYKRYPRDFIEGTIKLTFEEKGAYSVLLDLLYMRDGRLEDDSRWIAGQLNCSVRLWKKIRDALVEKGKLQIYNGIISNFRADLETESSRSFQHKQRENRSNPNKNNEFDTPKDHQNSTKQNQNQNHKEDDDSKRDALDPIFIDANGWASDSKRWVADILEQIPDLIPPSNIAVLTGWRDIDRFEWGDVIMGIKVTMSRKGYDPPRSWKYFAPAIQEAKNDRTTPTPERKSNGNGTHHTKPNTGRSVAGLAAAIADANKGRFS